MFYALWGIVEFIITSRSSKGPTLYQGVFGALFAAAVIPVISHYISKKKQTLFSYHLIIIFILLLALFSTFSRGTMLSYLMVLPVLFFTAYRQKLANFKNVSAILILTLASYSTITFYADLTDGQSLSAKTELQAGQITELKSMGARLKLYCSMLDIYSDYPLLGTGIASFKIFYRSYRDPSEISAGNFGHNDYLQFLQEGGPVLLTFLLLALSLIAWILYQCNFKNKGSLQTAGLALASSTLFIHAAADMIFYVFSLLMLAGLLLGISYHTIETAKQSPLTLDRPKLMGSLLISGIFLSWLSLAIDTHIYSHLVWQHLWGKDYQATVADLDTLDQYHRLRPNNPEPLVRLAELSIYMMKEVETEQEKMAMAQSALHYTLKLLNISPRFSKMYLRLAEIASLAPSLQAEISKKTQRYGISQQSNLKEQLLKKALLLDPNNNLASITLAKFYQQQQSPQKALDILKNAEVWLNIPKRINSLEAFKRGHEYKQKILGEIKQLEKFIG
jgi:hypothetical protein